MERDCESRWKLYMLENDGGRRPSKGQRLSFCAPLETTCRPQWNASHEMVPKELCEPRRDGLSSHCERARRYMRVHTSNTLHQVKHLHVCAGIV